MRTQPTSIRGLIALIRKGSRQIDGVATLVDVLPRLTDDGLSDSFEFHHVPSHRHQEVVDAGWLTPWVLLDAQRFSAPVPFVRPPGAVTWVDLDTVVFRNARSGHRGFRHSAFRVFSGYDGQEPEANGWLLPEVSGDTAFASVLLAVKAMESRAA